MSFRLLCKSKPVVISSRRWTGQIPVVPQNVDFDTKYTLFERFKQFVGYHVGLPSEVTYSEYAIRLAHKRDQIDHKQWYLIYNDLFITKLHSWMYALLFIASFGIIKAFVDLKHHGEVQSPAWRKFKKDFVGAGFFKYIFSFFVLNSTFWVLRTVAVKTRRVYQNIQNPNQYLLSRNAFGFFKQTIKLDRSEVKPLPSTSTIEYVNQNPLLANARLMLFGNVRIKNKPMVMESTFFRGNQFFSYFLHYTDRNPFGSNIGGKGVQVEKIRPF